MRLPNLAFFFDTSAWSYERLKGGRGGYTWLSTNTTFLDVDDDGEGAYSWSCSAVQHTFISVVDPLVKRSITRLFFLLFRLSLDVAMRLCPPGRFYELMEEPHCGLNYLVEASI